jgi:hypothetical protein
VALCPQSIYCGMPSEELFKIMGEKNIKLVLE